MAHGWGIDRLKVMLPPPTAGAIGESAEMVAWLWLFGILIDWGIGAYLNRADRQQLQIVKVTDCFLTTDLRQAVIAEHCGEDCRRVNSVESACIKSVYPFSYPPPNCPWSTALHLLKRSAVYIGAKSMSICSQRP